MLNTQPLLTLLRLCPESRRDCGETRVPEGLSTDRMSRFNLGERQKSALPLTEEDKKKKNLPETNGR